MNKSESKLNQSNRFSERQFASEWGNTAKHSRGTKKVLRNRVRAKENQMLRNGKFQMEDE